MFTYQTPLSIRPSSDTPTRFSRSQQLIVIPEVSRFSRAPSLPTFDNWNDGTNILTRNCRLFMYDVEPTTPSLAPGVYNILMPQPGALGGQPINHMDMIPGKWTKATRAFRRALEFDGLKPVSETKLKDIRPLPGHYLVSAFLGLVDTGEVMPGTWRIDHHCQRQDPVTERWYHKGGWVDPVTDRDAGGKVITDPTTADFGGYVHFTGFMWARIGGLHINLTPVPARPLDVGPAQSHRCIIAS